MFCAAASSKSGGRSAFAGGYAGLATENGRGGSATGARWRICERGHGGISGRCAVELLFFGSEYAFAGGTSGDGTGHGPGFGKTANRDRSGAPVAVCVGDDYTTRACDGSSTVCGGSG